MDVATAVVPLLLTNLVTGRLAADRVVGWSCEVADAAALAWEDG